jgi:hypothetical protein
LSKPFFVNFLSSGPNSYAHAGSAEADTATFFKAPALDIRPARSVSVCIASRTDDGTAFTTFASATAVFIADHANVLNAALRHD